MKESLKIVGYGVNVMYRRDAGFERLATFSTEEDARMFHTQFKKSSEYALCKCTDIQRIYQDENGEYEYETVLEILRVRTA